MMPAYLPNSAAAAIGGKIPIDLGKNWRDGRRIFGDGKTFRGFFGGVSCGIIVGCIEVYVQYAGYVQFFPGLTIWSAVLLAFGALLGDLVKSFFKRRLNKNRGDKWIVADQYDFVAGAFLLVFLFDNAWFMQEMTIPVLVTVLILTPILHRAVNIIGYAIGVKDVPW